MHKLISAAVGASLAMLTASAPAMAQNIGGLARDGGNGALSSGGVSNSSPGYGGGRGGRDRIFEGPHRGGYGGGPGYRRHFGRGGGAGIGIGAGLAAGALVGGAIASQGYYQNYGPGPGYGYGYDEGQYADADAVDVGGPPAGDAEAYCRSRFKSYDPSSGTYLGYDGARHPCP